MRPNARFGTKIHNIVSRYANNDIGEVFLKYATYLIFFGRAAN